MRRANLARQISIHMNIRQDVVEAVLKGLEDILVDEIVNKGETNFLRIFSVEPKRWGKSYDMGFGNKVEPHNRLVIKLSRTVRSLWKTRFDVFDGRDDAITRNNWREIYSDFHTFKYKSDGDYAEVLDDEDDSSFTVPDDIKIATDSVYGDAPADPNNPFL